jgi:hypothetical protein
MCDDAHDVEVCDEQRCVALRGAEVGCEAWEVECWEEVRQALCNRCQAEDVEYRLGPEAVRQRLFLADADVVVLWCCCRVLEAPVGLDEGERDGA